jgi:hypothetical protein
MPQEMILQYHVSPIISLLKEKNKEYVTTGINYKSNFLKQTHSSNIHINCFIENCLKIILVHKIYLCAFFPAVCCNTSHNERFANHSLGTTGLD